jgi:predicted Holliday junction resolvase-like endonuclease
MKHKLTIALFLSLFVAVYSVHAQSSSMKKIQAELEQKKQHGNEQLAKAHQQQQQAKNENRPSNAPSFQQQPNSNSSKQSGQQQPLMNNPNKKEEINQ